MRRRRLTAHAGAAFVCAVMATVPAAALTPLSDEALGGIRAGYVSVDGVSFAFTAEARSFVDGALVLESRFQIDGDGRRENIAAAATVLGLGGVTTISHVFGANDLRSVIVNTANDRVLLQRLDIAIVIPDLAAFQQYTIDQQRVLRLVDALSVNVRDAIAR